MTPAGGPSAFTENDLATPQDDLIGNEISPLDLTVYKGKNDDESNTVSESGTYEHAITTVKKLIYIHIYIHIGD